MQIWLVMILSPQKGVEVCRAYGDADKAGVLGRELAKQLGWNGKVEERVVPQERLPKTGFTGADVIRDVLISKAMLYVCPGEKLVMVRPAPLGKIKFCPECGCQWISHFKGPADLEPVDWEPCPCSECSCVTAVNGGGSM